MRPADVFDLLAPLTFAMTGVSKDGLVYSPAGTGFFIAPYVGLTAEHVREALWDELAMPWKRGKYPANTVEPDFYLLARHMLDHRRPEVVAAWEITGSTPSVYTDIAFVNLIPQSDSAKILTWPNGFPSIELLPPSVGEEVWALGYPGTIAQHTSGDFDATLAVQATLVWGTVVEHFDRGRGSWRFPHFQVSIPFEPGMSGAPLLHHGRLCGVVSYGPEYEDGLGESYAAAMWPLLLDEVTPSLDPRLLNTPLIDMLRSGQIRAENWALIREKMRVGRTESGYPIVELAQDL